MLALGGVLNLVGESDRQPLRLGGHQVAYAAGLSAFTGLVSALCGTAAEVVHVSLLENAVWLNWKNVASAEAGGNSSKRQAGVVECHQSVSPSLADSISGAGLGRSGALPSR